MFVSHKGHLGVAGKQGVGMNAWVGVWRRWSMRVWCVSAIHSTSACVMCEWLYIQKCKWGDKSASAMTIPVTARQSEWQCCDEWVQHNVYLCEARWTTVVWQMSECYLTVPIWSKVNNNAITSSTVCHVFVHQGLQTLFQCQLLLSLCRFWFRVGSCPEPWRLQHGWYLHLLSMWLFWDVFRASHVLAHWCWGTGNFLCHFSDTGHIVIFIQHQDYGFEQCEGAVIIQMMDQRAKSSPVEDSYKVRHLYRY